MSTRNSRNLGRGWVLQLEGEHAYVLAPFGRGSASLTFALECGCMSDDEDVLVPTEVMLELEKYGEKYR